MSLYAQAIAAERAAKIARDMADHEAGIESLRQQLAAALAAIKVKDEALDEARHTLADERIWSTVTICEKAIRIKPDDSALKAWLGEPVMYMDKDDCIIHVEDIEWRIPAQFRPIYSPKGMTK